MLLITLMLLVGGTLEEVVKAMFATTCSTTERQNTDPLLVLSLLSIIQGVTLITR
jgi:hypothetical protein